MQRNKSWFFRQNIYTADLSIQQRDRLEKASDTLELRKRQSIWMPGDPADHIFFVRSGMVKLSKVTEDGRELTLHLVERNELLGEFAAVIGRKAKDVPREEALDYIFGYTIFNDVSGRDYQMTEMPGLLGPAKSKDFDTGTILGPCIVTADEIDPYDLDMIARINGKEVSRGNSGSMYHKFEDCIEHVTRCETLYPGEIIASGTVGGGSGFESFSLLSVNDEIELEVKGIGKIKNRIVAGPVRGKTKVVRQNPEIRGRWSDLGLKKWPYEKGLHSLSNGVYAWLEPDGSWGFSNAGLIVDGDRSLLVDTLFDLSFTRKMLDAVKAAEPNAAACIDILVNTHGDGDHWFGNELAGAAEIMATSAAIEDMKKVPPGYLALNMSIAGNAPTPLGRMLSRIFASYCFDGITPTYPNKIVDRKTPLMLGSKRVELIPAGPAHTHGDMMVYIPDDRILFTGDIIFAGVTPVIHSGPFSNYIKVCRTILEMDVDVIVPGHGPITDKEAVKSMIEYLEYVQFESGKRYDAGMSTIKAAGDIDLKEFLGWHCPERLILNVIAAYQELTGVEKNSIERFFLMAELGDF